MALAGELRNGGRSETAAELLALLMELEPLVGVDALVPGEADSEDRGRAYVAACEHLQRFAPATLPVGRTAIDQLERGLDVAYRIESRRGLPAIARGYAMELDRAGRGREALSVLRRAHEATPPDEKRRVYLGPIWAGIALGALDYDEADDALTALASSIADARRLDPEWGYLPRAEGERLGFRVQLALELSLLDHAAGHLESLSAHAEQTSEKFDDAELAKLRVDHYLALPRHAKAIRVAEDALAADWIDSSPGAVATLELTCALGLVEKAKGDPDVREAALASFAELLAREDLTSIQRARAYLWAAELERRNEELERAGEHLEAAANALGARNEAARRTPALSCLFATIDSRVRGDHNARLERMRAELEHFLESWSQLAPHEEGAGYLYLQEPRAFLGDLIELELAEAGAEGGVRAAFDILQRVQGLGSIARAASYENRSLEDVRAALAPSDTGLILFLAAPDGSHAIVLDSEGALHVGLAPSTEIIELRKRFVRSIKQATRGAVSDSEQAFEAAVRTTEFGELLFPAELRERMESWDGLTVVGLEPFGYVPLEALPWSTEGDVLTTVGQRFALTVLPSVPIGMLSDEARRAPVSRDEATAWLIAPSEIPVDARAAQRLLGAFGGRARQRLGEQAILAALFDPDLGDALLLQIVAHGVQRERAHPTGFRLSPDAQGRAGDVFHEQLATLRAPRAVMLAVCDAGDSAPRYGEDHAPGLARTFIDRGAEVVVLPRLEVEYAASVALFERAGLHLLDGASMAEALRRARVELARDGIAQHPSYHLFQVVGLGHRALVDP